jgi:hypothetical protein
VTEVVLASASGEFKQMSSGVWSPCYYLQFSERQPCVEFGRHEQVLRCFGCRALEAFHRCMEILWPT